jgi:hypothetical protein
MTCDFTQLKKILIETISDETGLAGVPIEVVERRMQDRIKIEKLQCDLSHIRIVIQQALDDWEIDKTIDELTYAKLRELELPVESGFTWHLKKLSPEKTEFYKSLKPEDMALIRLLRMQNDSINLGVMPRDESYRRLEEQGFSEAEVRRIHIRDTIEEFWIRWCDNPRVLVIGLVHEYKKTLEYKQWQEEIDAEFDKKQARRERMVEECEITGPIHGYLDQLAEKREIDLIELLKNEGRMDKQEYLLKKAVIESRDDDEENEWNAILKTIFSLTFTDLIDLRGLFLGIDFPLLDEVQERLKKYEKKGS